MSLVDKILAEMEKEPELAVLNRPPLRSVQPSSDNQGQAENSPLLRQTDNGPTRLHFGTFGRHDFSMRVRNVRSRAEPVLGL